MTNSDSWRKIFNDYNILQHDFSRSYFPLSAEQIKQACQDFKKTAEKEVRILCKQDTRESRPLIFQQHELFILPIRNGQYAICKGEGYIDIPEITSEIQTYNSKLDFHLDSSDVGDSEMQHLDFAYASSLIRTFIGDPTLLLTIRGRKYTPKFSFKVGNITINAESVQTEVDAGYEGKDKIVLIEAKNSSVENTIIRQLFYPYRQWQAVTKKEIIPVFFERNAEQKVYNIWQYSFNDANDYNSIRLIKSGRYKIMGV